MTFEEYLKTQGIEDDVAKKVVEGMDKEKFYLSNEENIDDRYSKLKTQKEGLEDQLEKANDTIGTLKSDNKTNDELQTKITDYESEINSLKEQSADLMKQNAVDVTLIKNGAKNTKAVKALLDMNKIEMNDDGVKGLDEQLESLKENDSYLFQDDTKNPNIVNPEDNGGNDNDDKDAFDEVLENY